MQLLGDDDEVPEVPEFHPFIRRRYGFQLKSYWMPSQRGS
jgi:hypothetical protein